MSFVVPAERLSLTEEVAGDVSKQTTIQHEAYLLLSLAVPTVVIQLGLVVPPFLTASYVGRNFGYFYLDGFTLANLTGNLFTLAFLQGLYSASDTLSPQAFGAGNLREVGLLAIRGFVASLLILTPPTVILFFFMKPILIWTGQDERVSQHAQDWYRIYVLALPFYALYMVTWKFLSAQHTMTPLVIVVLVSSGLILPLSLEILTNLFGFLGSALAVLIFQAFEALALVLYLRWMKPHRTDTWPGIGTWREALHYEPMKRYMLLGMGGMLASSEWIYWEALSLMIGTLGVVPLSVHTIPTQTLTVSFMLPIGVGVALAIRLGATLPKNVLRAKELVVSCLAVSVLVFGVLSILMYEEREHVFRIFTTEPQVLQGCEEIWWHVCLYYFNLSVFGINMGIATGLGMQWTLGVVTIVFLWVLGLPAAYYFAVVRGGGLVAAWYCIFPPYIFINAVLMIAFVVKDWDEIARRIRLREGVVTGEMDELTLDVDDADAGYGATNTEVFSNSKQRLL